MRALEALVTIVVIGFYSGKVSVELIDVPRDTVARIGDTTYMNCSTNISSKKIHWHHGSYYVYTGWSVLIPYSGRFRIESSTAGAYNLVIPRVETGDAGTYKCKDDGGFGREASAELILIDGDPSCTPNITLDEEIERDNRSLQIACSLPYSGNSHPKLAWKSSGDKTSIMKGVAITTDGRAVIYSLTFEVDELMNDYRPFICETTQATTEQYNCSTPVIKTTQVTSISTSLGVTSTSASLGVTMLLEIAVSMISLNCQENS